MAGWGSSGGKNVGGGQLPGDTPAVDPAFFLFNEISNVSLNTETEILTYTAPNPSNIHILTINCTGSCIALFNIYYDDQLVDKKTSWYGQGLNVSFDYRMNPAGGRRIFPAKTISIRVITTHPRMTNNSFSATMHYHQIN